MKEIILDTFAPCGLNCEKCFARERGAIQKHAKELQNNLGNFDVYAEHFVELIGDHRFKNYPEFKNVLNLFTEGNCKGCRNEQCKLFSQCGVRACHQEKEIDFCFECNEFPCKKTNFDAHLQKRWITLNNHIRKIGIEQFYQETKDKARYV